MSGYTIQPKKCMLVADGTVINVPLKTIANAEQAHIVARAYLENLPHEEVIALVLNGRNEIRDVIKLAQGGLHGCALTTRDVLRPILTNSNASAFILAHNHPSGCPEASVEDIELTRSIKIASDIVGVPLLDHIIIGEHDWRSLAGII